MANAQDVGGGAGVIGVFDRAASLVVAGGAGVFFRPEAHGDAQHVEALLQEQAGGDGGVNTAGHGNRDSRLRHGYFML